VPVPHPTPKLGGGADLEETIDDMVAQDYRENL